jgi:hypothetical protein
VRNSILAGTLALVAISCGAPAGAFRGDADAVALTALVAERQGALRTMTGSGKLVYDGPDGTGAAEFSMALRRPDSLLVRVRGPFGITLGTLFVGGDAYVVYNSVENVAYAGQPGDRTMRALLPVELSLDEIMSAFSGTPDLPASAAGAELLRTEEGPSLTVPAPSGARTYLLDPERGAVARLEQRETGGTLLLRAEFSDFHDEGGATVPALVVVDLPSRETSLRLRYRELSVNGDPPSFRFTIPPDARIVRR